jgi:hypothetical protein
MANYYEILKVSPQASRAEIRSAYRRLARKLHPDRNNGSEETALKFAAIAEAYEVLGDNSERVRYDKRILETQFQANGNGDSVFASSNPHARRWRQMVYEKRYNDIIDRMIEEERREAMAFQKVIYPLVALFVSGILVTALRPRLFTLSAALGKIIIVSLFIVSVIHLIGRIRDGFERYTEFDDQIHDSILDDNERRAPRYSRYSAAATLLGGFLLCLGLGYVIGLFIGFPPDATPPIFSPTLKAEFIFYPPIMALFVDMMHSFASRFDAR